MTHLEFQNKLELRRKRLNESVYYTKIIEEVKCLDYSDFVIEQGEDVCKFRIYDSGEISKR